MSKFSAKNIGENYVMNYLDFSESATSLYGIASLANSPSGNAPDDNSGDFKILRLGTNNAKYNVLMLSSPRFDKLYVGKFWNGNWQGWNHIALKSDLVNIQYLANEFNAYNDTIALTSTATDGSKIQLTTDGTSLYLNKKLNGETDWTTVWKK